MIDFILTINQLKLKYKSKYFYFYGVMKNIVSFNLAVQLSVIIFSLLSLFHLTVIIGIIFFDLAPIKLLWGGKIKTIDELLKFEIISLVVSIFCLIIVLVRSQSLISIFIDFSRVTLWLLFFLFILNTIGNLIAESIFEKFFTLITLILSILCLRMALEPTK